MSASESRAGDPRAAPVTYDGMVRLSPLVRRITQRNPGLFTGPGTNTHLVGRTALFVLDPGEARDDGHLERIVAAIGGTRVAAVIPSHGHPDHWPLAPRLAEAVDAPIRAFGGHPGFPVDQPIADDEMLDADGVELRALHTPGHARDHLSFVLPAERALFPGDHVMGWSTSIIDPPDGDLAAYLASLERLLALPGVDVAYPAHGPAIVAPAHRMRELHAHREERTRQLLAALRDGPSRLPALVATIYADVDPALHPAAARSLTAHLLALEAADRIARAPGSEGLALEEAAWRLVEG